MRRLLFAMAGLAVFGLSSCNNAANKIKSEEDKSETTSNTSDAGNNTASPANNSQNQVSPEAVSQEGNPQFKFEKESHDFGTITEGEVAKHDFTFTNTGDSPLIITNASGSCGCTVPSWPREPIAPGETGTIHVEFNSTNRTGNQTKQVTLSANTTPNKKILRIQAQVNPKAENAEGADKAANS